VFAAIRGKPAPPACITPAVNARLPVGVVLLAAAAFLGCGEGHASLTRSYRIPSPAMQPTVKVGDIVKADVLAYRNHPPQRGDVVIFRPPRGAATQTCGVPSEPTDGRPCERPSGGPDDSVTFIKRIVGLPGEWLKVDGNRTFIATRRRGPFVQQKEPFIAQATPCDLLCNLRKPVRIPPGHYYTMGDNRGESDDSRDWGPIPPSSIIGKVVSGLR
jgi:signal peptidase I